VVTKIELFQTPNVIPLDFCLWVSMQRDVYNRKIIKRDKFLARIVNAAARTEKREDQLRQNRRDIRTRVAKCIEVDGRIFEHLLQTATKFYFSH
jgi:hypothetical protein